MTLKANVILVKDVDSDVALATEGRSGRPAKQDSHRAHRICRRVYQVMSNKGRMLVNGEFAPVVGRICMDQCMIDVTDLKHEVSVGDEVVIFGKQNGACISVDEIADQVGTINYELVCIIGKRIPRVYLKEGKICGVLNYLV